MSSHLDDVNALIKMRKGDLYRLEHIKKTLEDHKLLYVSDRKYLEELVKEHLTNFEEEKLPELNKYDYPEYKKRIDVPNAEPLPVQESGSIPTSKPESSTTTHKHTEDSKTTFCVNCGNLLTNENFCPKCGNKAKSNQNKKKIEPAVNYRGDYNNEKARSANIFASVFLGLFGFGVIIVGIGIIVGSLEMAAFIAGQYMILGLFVMVIGAAIIYGAKRLGKKKSHFICGFCKFVAETERELYNHALVCEKKLAEENSD